MITIKIYRNQCDQEPFNKWFYSLKNKQILARVDNRLTKVRLGNMGDHRSVGGGVFELRLHFGAGYRIYYGYMGKEIILLLAGGSKRSQAKDIKKAKQYWLEYKQLK